MAWREELGALALLDAPGAFGPVPAAERRAIRRYRVGAQARPTLISDLSRLMRGAGRPERSHPIAFIVATPLVQRFSRDG